jgi:MOSC domain-containing protein YiiM
MQELQRAEISTQAGVQGDSRGKTGNRQVTVLAAEDWRTACDAVGRDIPWTVRRANLLVEGLALARMTGATIRIGEVVLQVKRETDPCGRMDDQVEGLCEALRPAWRGGVCCRVLRGGTVAAGDEVILEPADGNSPPAEVR